MFDWLLIIICIAAALLWWDAVKAKELAKQAVARTCKSMQLQLLDDTVALNWLKLKRNSQGQVVFARSYQFEFSLNGAERYKGAVQLLGYKIQQMQIDNPHEQPEAAKQTYLQ
ncbi:DUF3301 domain-containing protein [Spartinivicinus poritis]|uniref:DUF3301 domain-containing protein n=1 Tax=Spartinivicinus poritis TaxID=2994640 RepID=A0ABT5UEQ1_9GAMM|nr:DUF3301 domain-containing protein [Spartinivicinus sp. A2-2]MDE1464461.1 DUF3301 domain-containing protein [Spartinivicinus sp. A2-2]